MQNPTRKTTSIQGGAADQPGGIDPPPTDGRHRRNLAASPGSASASAASILPSLRRSPGLNVALTFFAVHPTTSAGAHPEWVHACAPPVRRGTGAEEPARLYPDWHRFAAVRERRDPTGVFLCDDMRRLLVVAS